MDKIGSEKPVGRTQAAAPAYVAWKDLNVTVPVKGGGEKHILRNVAGCVEPQQMLAIMGPTGSGKSTLMDCLAGRLGGNTTTTGTVYLNGVASKLSYGGASYVPQTDLMLGTLTVRETLMYSALLRLPSSLSYADKAAIVADVMSDLGLADAANTPIGTWAIRGVSGGQKRRVSIGCELVTSPSLLFLDEPTSGLDAAASFHVMSLVRSLAQQGRTIISVIHQPSSETFELFDQLCLLAGGSQVYFGEAARATDIFDAGGIPCPARRNPADHFLMNINADFDRAGDRGKDIEAGRLTSVADSVASLTDAYQASPIAKRINDRVGELSSPSGLAPYERAPNQAAWLSQVGRLTQRTFSDSLRNVGVFWMRVLMYFVLCICMGTIYFRMGETWREVNSRASLLFFVAAFLTFMSIGAFPAFVENLSASHGERLNGAYGPAQYVIADFISSTPFIFLIAAVSGLSVYFLAGLNTDGDRFFYFVLDLFMALMVTESLMVAIAAIVPHFLFGIAAGAGVMGLYMLVCGFFQTTSELPKPVWKFPLHYMALHTYSFYGFMNNEFADTAAVWDCPCSLTGDCSEEQGGADCRVDGSAVLDAFDIVEKNKYIDIAILAGMVVAYRMCFVGAMKLREFLSKR